MRKGQQTKTRMIEATGRLLQEQGYFGTSLKQILEQSESPRGSLYFHFPEGKEQLACAALSDAGNSWRQRTEQAVSDAPDLASAIGAVCAMLSEELVASEFRAGCPLATVALEAAATVDAVHEICSEHYSGWQSFIGDKLVSVGVPQEVSPALATLVLSAIEGALLLSRAHRSVEPLNQVAASLSQIASLLPASTAPPVPPAASVPPAATA